MADWRRWRSRLVNTESEYRANLAGLNTLFGAVLGFVVSGIDRLETNDFVVLLAVCSAIVMCILYVSLGRRHWPYAILAILFIAGLPRIVPDQALPAKLQATLVVWVALSLLIEWMPRRPDEPAPDA